MSALRLRVAIPALAGVTATSERGLDSSLLARREIEGALLHVGDDAFDLNASLEAAQCAFEILVRMNFDNGQTVSPPSWPESAGSRRLPAGRRIRQGRANATWLRCPSRSTERTPKCSVSFESSGSVIVATSPTNSACSHSAAVVSRQTTS